MQYNHQATYIPGWKYHYVSLMPRIPERNAMFHYDFGHAICMPLGDPCGGNFEYTVEGLPENIFAFDIPVKDIGRSVAFYTDVLGMTLLGEDDGHAYLIRGGCRLILTKSGSAGICTGAIFGVDNPYNTRRRLIDEGVEFVMDPVRTPFGTCTSFKDPDGNVIAVMEQKAEFRI